ncbi:MAG: GIY-YIG nuclease family protein [Ignavibacteriae bacterium]|nr:GIY-YIG nuclease family protein [Ignavibacteriota bacterium]
MLHHKPVPYKLLTEHLPESSGVYLMYAGNGQLLYVGKSKTIRSRVRAHFHAPEERGMCRQVRRVEARETAGELGALLLESELIKKLKPMYNRALRKTRRLIVARKALTPQGYIKVAIEAVSTMEAVGNVAKSPRGGGERRSALKGAGKREREILGLFRTRTQAFEYLAEAAKEHKLCLALLGLEQTRRHCFAYHLHRCNGACMGEEAPEIYNARVEKAFEQRRIQAWPYDGAVLIEESSPAISETFIVDHWCLLYSFTHSTTSGDKPTFSVKGSHYFDYDAYKIIAGYMFDDTHAQTIKHIPRSELSEMLKKLKAA